MPRPRRSTIDVLDDWLLVAVAVVAALILLKVLSWIVGAVMLGLKVALVALFVAVALRLVRRGDD